MGNANTSVILYNHSAPCAHCNAGISKKVLDYSLNKFGRALCYCCQDYLGNKKRPSDEAFILYISLRNRLVPVELEKYDGHKTIDMAIPDAKVNIEVDGKFHNTDSIIAYADLLRTYYSLKEDFITLRIPNSLIHDNLEETANTITKLLVERKQNLLKAN